MQPRWLFAVAALAFVLAPGTTARAEQTPYDVDVVLENDLGRDVADLPVFLQVFRVFGRGVDYAKFNPQGFHVYDQAGRELEFQYRVVPPAFSIANDELVVALAKLPKDARVRLRVTNDKSKSAGQKPFTVERMLANPNQMLPDGGFEQGAGLWKGGRIVGDVVHSGSKALMLEVPGAGGEASMQCTKAFNFVKGRNYHFSFWGRCRNVTRRTWRYSQPWAHRLISGRVSFTGDPLVFPEFADNNHLVRLMDDSG